MLEGNGASKKKKKKKKWFYCFEHITANIFLTAINTSDETLLEKQGYKSNGRGFDVV
ncbi:hypothetical protein CROQUDRAFT_678093 [Cronartium quercuum f. sp. fusiforme G11]|uniref:Uncharacterized protein n=1 Tax=Cronartium quercuum f. sp. fusiforme G11 TaxID=708437 RepID=A0A9P6TGC7_9BASI|nr:hypothetical protein CROQUDRAFT_678093 [Cronartium quercuum f. sp. fusiforme G11]